MNVFLINNIFNCFLKGNMHEKLWSTLFGYIGIVITLFEIGSLCLVGQWLTTKSADILDASYECLWYNQSQSFKKTLLIMRFICQKEAKLGVIRFNFTHAYFYEVKRSDFFNKRIQISLFLTA